MARYIATAMSKSHKVLDESLALPGCRRRSIWPDRLPASRLHRVDGDGASVRCFCLTSCGATAVTATIDHGDRRALPPRRDAATGGEKYVPMNINFGAAAVCWQRSEAGGQAWSSGTACRAGA